MKYAVLRELIEREASGIEDDLRGYDGVLCAVLETLEGMGPNDNIREEVYDTIARSFTEHR